MQQPHLCHFEIQLARHSRYRWVPRFAESYSHLVALVSTLPKYLHEVTNKLIQEFDSPNTTHPTTKYSPKSSNTFPHQSTQSHNSCKKLPHHISSSTKELTNYVQNLVRVLDYTPELQFSIWQLIIESSIKLDVELQNELDDLDDEEIEDLISGEEDSDSEDEWEVTTTSIKPPVQTR